MEGAAQTVLSNAGQLLTGEYQQLRGIGGEVAELRDDLAAMNALLRMQSDAKDGTVDPFIQEIMKQVRELAYDSEDRIDLYRLRIKCRPGDGVFARFKHLLQTLTSRRRLAGDVRALRVRAIAISERHARYGVNREALRYSPALSSTPMLMAYAPAQALSRGGPGQHQVIGIQKQADGLVKQLKASIAGEKYLKVFSVVGFGGVGKTTLAMEVCRLLEKDFPYQAMVSVSQAFEPSRDLTALLRRVLQQIIKPKKGIKEEESLANIDGNKADELAKILERALEDKRYLIVIDDVWTIGAWDAIQATLPENMCESRIIVTTRIDTVAKACSPASVSGHCIHHMKPLKREASKELFLSRAFGSVSASCPTGLEDVMEEILKRCGGLPLAIVSIASVLAGYGSSGCKEKWENVCRSISSHMETNPTLEGMRQIVTLSYNHLPYELKGCMMYLSIFPEDYEINRDRLLRRWIAEGLVLEKRGLTQMEVAGSYLDELVSRNMIEPRFGFDGKVESCRLHDMLLEVMVSKSLECNFISLLGGQYVGMSYDRIRRLSIQGDDGKRLQDVDQHTKDQSRKYFAGGIEGMDVRHVRSLSMFQLQWHKLLDHLDKFTLLRVLDLEDCEGLTNDHMRYVCQMYLLKFLNLRGTNISKMPPELGKLQHLQTLDVLRTCMSYLLPQTVTNLEKLERIELSHKTDWWINWRLPRGIRKMNALCVVHNAMIGNDVQVAQELGELQRLQSLNLCIDRNVNAEVLKELAGSLSKLYSLRSLEIYHVACHEGKIPFLYDLPKPPRLLRHLFIHGVLDQNRGLPIWVESLTYLVEVIIMHTEIVGDQIFRVLCKLPNLKSISLDRKCCSDQKIVARTSHNFPVLVNLSVPCDSPLPNAFSFEKGSMPELHTLKMRFTQQKRCIEGIEHLINLREAELISPKNGCNSLKEALHQIEAENSRRPESSQIQVVVKYI